jgi:hypothetical protein
METYHCIVPRSPFPLMGKGRDKGAREPIKTITPTFVLPRQGEGLRKSANSASQTSNFKGGHEQHEFNKFENIKFLNPSVLRALLVVRSYLSLPL